MRTVRLTGGLIRLTADKSVTKRRLVIIAVGSMGLPNGGGFLAFVVFRTRS